MRAWTTLTEESRLRPDIGEIVSADVDWITATAAGGDNSESMFESGRVWLGEAVTEGNSIKPWGMAGFTGQKAGRVQCGTRGEEVMVRLSSHAASTYWRELAAVCDNCSRLDLQTTVRYERGPREILRTHFTAACEVFRVVDVRSELSFAN